MDAALQLSWTDIATERNLLQLRVICLCDRFSAHVFASRAFVTVTLAANMRGSIWTQIVFEGKTDRVHLMKGRTVSTRQSRGASRARCRDPNQRQRLADDDSSDDGEDPSGKRCSKASYPYHLR